MYIARRLLCMWPSLLCLVALLQLVQAVHLVMQHVPTFPRIATLRANFSGPTSFHLDSGELVLDSFRKAGLSHSKVGSLRPDRGRRKPTRRHNSTWTVRPVSEHPNPEHSSVRFKPSTRRKAPSKSTSADHAPSLTSDANHSSQSRPNRRRRPESMSSVSTSTSSAQSNRSKDALNNLMYNNRLTDCDCSIKARPKIIGGSDAPNDQYPFVAAIFTLVGRGSFCGASIVNERFLLTAAHCVARYANRPHLYTIVVGRTDLNVSNAPHELLTPAERIWLNGRLNDVALVRLAKPIRFNVRVRPACFAGHAVSAALTVHAPTGSVGDGKFAFDTSTDHFDPGANVQSALNRSTKSLTAIGWGYVGWQSRPGSSSRRPQMRPLLTSRLQEVTLKQVPCTHEPHLLCVAGDQKSPCFGDSGSPLLFTTSGRQLVVGLTSRSSSSAAKYCLGAPTIYERTSFYLPWMRTITQNRFCEVE
jgi:hypothetical protein